MNRNSDRPSIDELARRLAESLPAGLRSMREELEQNFRSVLRSGLDRLDLVTREEFEVQRLVLERTREKLDALSARLEDLERVAPRKAPAKKKAARRKTQGGKDKGGKDKGGKDKASKDKASQDEGSETWRSKTGNARPPGTGDDSGQ